VSIFSVFIKISVMDSSRKRFDYFFNTINTKELQLEVINNVCCKSGVF
jgi:hypothetical protein